MTSPAPAWLVSFASNRVDVPLLAKLGGHRSYRKGDINSCTNSYDLPYCEIFKINNTNLQFRSPGYGWRKNKNKNKKNTGNCNAFCISCRRKNVRNFQFYLLNSAKEFCSCLLWCHIFISIRWNVANTWHLYYFNRKNFFFSFVRMMMWSSIEMKSKFLQNLKTISSTVFFKYCPSKHFNALSTLFLGRYDVATSHNVKSTLKQRCVSQRWNL